jgi:cell fate regulator YaaT (PSP1 superfamily)
MPRQLAGVRFQRGGRVYYCDPGALDLQVNDPLVVEADWGPVVGWVVIAPHQVIHAEGVEDLLRIVRRATPEDLAPQSATPGG